jgi:hypothetical protein
VISCKIILSKKYANVDTNEESDRQTDRQTDTNTPLYILVTVYSLRDINIIKILFLASKLFYSG